MNYNNVTNEYYENSVETETPGNLVIKLYEGAIRFLYLAEDGFTPNARGFINHQEINTNLLKAQAIIHELRTTINYNGGEIAKQLESLYAYMYQKLVDANRKKDLKLVIEVRGLLEELLEAWLNIV